MTSTPVHPVELHDKASEYVRLAEQAARGEVPGSSAGGEQPKFVSYVQTPDGPRHVIVKFTLDDHNPVTGRWRDLLLAEHLALETLNESGIPAVRTRIVDSGFQRFLEIERFDRVGVSGRKGLISMKHLMPSLSVQELPNGPLLPMRWQKRSALPGKRQRLPRYCKPSES